MLSYWFGANGSLIVSDAAYWRAVSTYSRHLAHALSATGPAT